MPYSQKQLDHRKKLVQSFKALYDGVRDVQAYQLIPEKKHALEQLQAKLEAYDKDPEVELYECAYDLHSENCKSKIAEIEALISSQTLRQGVTAMLPKTVQKLASTVLYDQTLGRRHGHGTSLSYKHIVTLFNQFKELMEEAAILNDERKLAQKIGLSLLSNLPDEKTQKTILIILGNSPVSPTFRTLEDMLVGIISANLQAQEEGASGLDLKKVADDMKYAMQVTLKQYLHENEDALFVIEQDKAVQSMETIEFARYASYMLQLELLVKEAGSAADDLMPKMVAWVKDNIPIKTLVNKDVLTRLATLADKTNDYLSDNEKNPYPKANGIERANLTNDATTLSAASVIVLEDTIKNVLKRMAHEQKQLEEMGIRKPAPDDDFTKLVTRAQDDMYRLTLDDIKLISSSCMSDEKLKQQGERGVTLSDLNNALYQMKDLMGLLPKSSSPQAKH